VDHAIQTGNINEVMSALKMTSQENDVITHIAAGKSNKEIAVALNIAVHSIENHIRNILDKLALHTRLELATLTQAEDLP
jgi:two-component system NarL family response regulator